jgi:hypothetical protein
MKALHFEKFRPIEMSTERLKQQHLAEDFKLKDIKSKDIKLKNTKSEDSNPEDSSAEDTNPEDSSAEDTNLEDSSLEDNNLEDSSAEDNNLEDSSTEDNNLEDSSHGETLLVSPLGTSAAQSRRARDQDRLYVLGWILEQIADGTSRIKRKRTRTMPLTLCKNTKNMSPHSY